MAAGQRGMEGGREEEEVGQRGWGEGGGEGTEQPGLPDVHFGTEACCARIISTAVTPFWFGAAAR